MMAIWKVGKIDVRDLIDPIKKDIKEIVLLILQSIVGSMLNERLFTSIKFNYLWKIYVIL